VLEPRSNTMKLGVMKDQLPASLTQADKVFCYAANLGWDAAGALAPLGERGRGSSRIWIGWWRRWPRRHRPATMCS
jgi:hypothetical protein